MHNVIRSIDALLSRLGNIVQYRGLWSASTAYTVGDVVADPDSGALWSAAVAHVSTESGTFSVFRTAFPIYWAMTQSADVLPRHHHGVSVPTVTTATLIADVQQYDTGSDASILDPRYVSVYIGGVLQIPTTDYLMSADGSAIVLVAPVLSTPADGEWAAGLQLVIREDIFPRTGASIGYREITQDNIATETITTRCIADEAITADKIAPDVFVAHNIADGSITTTKIANSAVTTDKINAAAISTSKIVDNAVVADKIAAGAVIASKLATGAVPTAAVQDSAITSAKLAADAVTNSKIVDANITTAKIADSNVTSDKIADLAIVAAKIANGAVSGAKIADAGIVAAKLETRAGLTAAEYVLGIATVNAQGLVTAMAEMWHAAITFTAAATPVVAKAVNCSVARTVAGKYTITFTAASPDALYFVAGSYSSSTNKNSQVTIMNQAAGSVEAWVVEPSGDLLEAGTVTVICLRIPQ